MRKACSHTIRIPQWTAEVIKYGTEKEVMEILCDLILEGPKKLVKN